MNWMELRFPRYVSPWRVFESYLDYPSSGREVKTEDYCPAVDIIEGEDRYRIRVELPGLSDKDFTLETRDGHMTLSGSWPEEDEEKKEKTICQEISRGKFSRTFHLPERVDTEKIEAKFDRGILEITLPLKGEEKPKSIRVEVH